MTVTNQIPISPTIPARELLADLNDPTAGSVAISRELASEQVRMIADPAPLGLAAFALTTFLLSLVNVGVMPKDTEPVMLGVALAFGGIAQLLAGMWEFRKGNVFGATVFSSYGAFWLSFWAYLTFYAKDIPAEHHGVAAGWYLIAWAIFTSLMLVAALRTTAVLAVLFAVLDAAFVLLASRRVQRQCRPDHCRRSTRPRRRRTGLVPMRCRRHRINIRPADPAQPFVGPTLSSAPSYLNSHLPPSQRKSWQAITFHSSILQEEYHVGPGRIAIQHIGQGQGDHHRKVVLPAESLSGGTEVRDKVVTATEAVRLIRDGDSVVVEGFVGQCFAEELTLALEQRFLLTGTPQDLTLVFTVAPGDRQGRGLDRLAHDGLIKRAVGGHWGLSPALGKMAVDNTIEAHNLPQGVISQLFRDTAAGKPGSDHPGRTGHLRRPASRRRQD